MYNIIKPNYKWIGFDSKLGLIKKYTLKAIVAAQDRTGDL